MSANGLTPPVPLGFERQCIHLLVAKLHASKKLPVTIKNGMKYKQILQSIQSIGLVEPVVVIQHPDYQQEFSILDGHLRIEALKDLKIEQVLCLIAKDNEAYTYNKCVNRLTSVQEHRMVLLANQNGVATATLAAALGISAQAIRERFRLMDGICSEAARLLADKPVPRTVFPIMREMKAFRQIDVANFMINLNNYSIKFAKAMLHATRADQLVESKKTLKSQQNGASDTLLRIERELVSVQADTKLLEESYGPANLELTIIKTHIKNLLDNPRVVRWLLKNQRDYFEQLQLISE